MATRRSCSTPSNAAWKSAGGKRERARYSPYAKATFRKDRRLNIRLSSKDLDSIEKRALAEGLPYQTLISSLLHKYASGRVRRCVEGEGCVEGRRRERALCELPDSPNTAYRLRFISAFSIALALAMTPVAANGVKGGISCGTV